MQLAWRVVALRCLTVTGAANRMTGLCGFQNAMSTRYISTSTSVVFTLPVLTSIPLSLL